MDRNVFNGTEKEWTAWLKRARVIKGDPEDVEETASIRSYLPF